MTRFAAQRKAPGLAALAALLILLRNIKKKVKNTVNGVDIGGQR
jgi:hypothetical protein